MKAPHVVGYPEQQSLLCAAEQPACSCRCRLCCPAAVAIKGNFLLGINFLIVSLYPIRVGATLMSSFLVNTALILAMSCAVIQFCASAFSAYANSSMIFGIFGSQVRCACPASLVMTPPCNLPNACMSVFQGANDPAGACAQGSTHCSPCCPAHP